MNKKLKIFLSVFAIAVVIGIVTAWCMWHKPHRDVKDADAIKTTAIELYNSFLNDSSGAKTKFTNNIVEATGEITQVDKNQQGQVIVFLKTNVANASVNCTMEGDAKNSKQGDKITIKGICNGYNSGDTDIGIPGDVVLIRCYISN